MSTKVKLPLTFIQNYATVPYSLITHSHGDHKVLFAILGSVALSSLLEECGGTVIPSRSYRFLWLLLATHMKTKGYLEHLDLGIDPDTSKPNILVRDVEEYRRLSMEEKERAWAIIKTASEITELSVAVIYKELYAGKLTSKVIKKQAWDRIGLTLVRVIGIYTRSDKRSADIQRVMRIIKRTLKATTWLPEVHQILIAGELDTYLKRAEAGLSAVATVKGGNFHGTE